MMERESLPSARVDGSVGGVLQGLVLAVAVGGALVVAGGPAATGGLSRDYLAPSLPAGLDTLAPVDEVLERVRGCGSEGTAAPAGDRAAGREPSGASAKERCTGVVYVWSPRMPLSRLGMTEIVRATDALGVELTLMGASPLYEADEAAPRAPTTPRDSLVRDMLVAGATVHHPALLVHRDGRLLGPAILGYKVSEAYRRLIAERLAGEEERLAAHDVVTGVEPASRPTPRPVRRPLVARDFVVEGSPGAYFRWVPGTELIAFEMDRAIHLLDLSTGERMIAPGYVDFVPTPDGRLFVTPSPGRSGLAFYDAREVLEAARRGESETVLPVYTDRQLRDQYPSAGILHSDVGDEGATIDYRVLTSWFSGVVYRDYRVEIPSGGGRPVVKPLDDPVVPCPEGPVSIPIMSKDGTEVAGRDGRAATTRIFRMDTVGTCEVVHDLGVQSGKVAFGPRGRRVAYAVPRNSIRDGVGRRFPGEEEQRRGEPGNLEGIFVLDRDEETTVRVAESREANRLAFPEFVGADSVVFLIPGEEGSGTSRFRLVCCLD